MIRRRSATYWRAPKAPTMTEMDSPAATVSLSVYATIGSITWSSCLRKGFVEVLSRQISPAATEHVSLGLDQVGVDDIVDQLDRHSTLQGQASQPPSSVTILDDEHVLVAISGCIGDTGSSHHVQHALQSGAVITNGIGKELPREWKIGCVDAVGAHLWPLKRGGATPPPPPASSDQLVLIRSQAFVYSRRSFPRSSKICSLARTSAGGLIDGLLRRFSGRRASAAVFTVQLVKRSAFLAALSGRIMNCMKSLAFSTFGAEASMQMSSWYIVAPSAGHLRSSGLPRCHPRSPAGSHRSERRRCSVPVRR